MGTLSARYHMIDWQEATLVEQSSGSFDTEAVRATVASIAGSGTGNLAGTTPKYDVVFGGEGPYPLSIETSSEREV